VVLVVVILVPAAAPADDHDDNDDECCWQVRLSPQDASGVTEVNQLEEKQVLLWPEVTPDDDAPHITFRSDGVTNCSA
jgi:hypothetical protein